MPLLDICKTDDVARLEEYLRDNDDPDQSLKLPDSTLPEILLNSPPLISVCAFYGATQCFNLLQAHNAEISLPDRKGRVPVHFASAGSVELCDLLESVGADFSVTDSQGMNCLHFACQYGNFEMVKRFAVQDCDLNSMTCDNLAPIHFACMAGREDIVEYLLEREVAVSPIANDGRTPLLVALRQGSSRVLRVLADHQADLNIIESDELTPLMWAAKRGNVEVTELLLESGQLDVNQPDEQLGWTALHFAAEAGHLPIVEQLISKNASVGAKTNAGMTALHFAKNRQHPEVEALLVAEGGAL
jgi:ankyrin